MMSNLFNSTFENSLRIVILLDAFEKPINLDMIYVTDFIVSYGKDFGVSTDNLNGDNPYKYSEFASRREIISAALKHLVLEGLVLPQNTNNGIIYCLTSDGKTFSQALNSEYAKEYRKTTQNTLTYVSNKNERELIARINKMSAQSLQKGV